MPDELSAHYQTIDGAGVVGAEFEGRIYAKQGVDIDAFGGFNYVRWLKELGGIAAGIFGFETGTNSLVATAEPNGAVTLLNGNDQSGFLRLKTTAKRTIAFGEASVDFVASALGSKVVAHGLNVAPAVVLATARHENILASVGAVDSTNITVVGKQKSDIAFTGTITIDWLAIG